MKQDGYWFRMDTDLGCHTQISIPVLRTHRHSPDLNRKAQTAVHSLKWGRGGKVGRDPNGLSVLKKAEATQRIHRTRNAVSPSTLKRALQGTQKYCFNTGKKKKVLIAVNDFHGSLNHLPH